MKTKICSKCGKRKKLSEFHKDKKGKNGLRSFCKECSRIIAHENYLKNQEEIKARTKKYYEENKDYYSEYIREYRVKNKDKLQQRLKQNADKIREQKRKLYFEKIKENPNYNHERYLERKEYYAEYSKEYRETHKKEINAQKNEYDKNKRKNNIGFKILCALRIRMYDVLKGRTKSDTTKNLLGCSIEDFKKYLESNFKKGMNWDNYGRGGWHIDHIKPCASFDLSKEKEQRKCFFFKNLQPLWELENLKKGSKI